MGTYEEKMPSAGKPLSAENCKEISRISSATNSRERNRTEIFACEICRKYKTSSNACFQRHQRLVHDIGADSVNDCLFCNKKQSNFYHLQTHLRLHTREKPFFCKLCETTFASNSELQCHFRIHTGEKPYTCKVCNKPFRQWSDMKRHYQRHFKMKPKPVPKYKCNQCGMQFMKKKELIDHERKTHTVKVVRTKTNKLPEYASCPKCSKIIKRKCLQKHLECHGERKFECDICGKYKSTTRNTLLRHQRLVHNIGAPSVNDCLFCQKKLCTVWELENHLRTHTLERPFSCIICSKEFYSGGLLKQHLKTFHDKEPTQNPGLQCPICSVKLSNPGYFKLHLQTHLIEKPHKCEMCPKSFVRKIQLESHMRLHTREKPYFCKFCKKGFACTSTLNAHIRVHTGDKPYPCKICGKAFTQWSDMKKHAVLHSKPNKKINCKYCERTFHKMETLKVHEKSHTVFKPFSCQICKRKFTLKCHLQTHLNAKHN